MNIKGGLDCRVTGALGNIYHYINYQHPSSSDYFWHAIIYTTCQKSGIKKVMN